MTLAMDAALRDAVTAHLPAPIQEGRFGEQWGNPATDGWQVTRTVRGVDLWTRIDELSEDQAEACGLAMLAAATRGRAVFGGLDQAVAPLRSVGRGAR